MTDQPSSPPPVDAVVIGGGAAGLSAALTLVRARRSVLVIDSCEPRNAPAVGVHGFLTRDGMNPFDLVAAGRAEVESYGGRIRRGRVTGARRAPDGIGFVTELDDGSEVSSRRLIVTSGLTDVLPAIDGLRSRFGRDAVHCPYCHGWEIRDRALGVIGTSARAVHQALLFRQWSDDVTLILHEPVALEAGDLAKLEARRIRVVAGPVTSLRIEADALVGVDVSGGGTVPVAAIAVMPRFEARAAFLSRLGLIPTEHPMGVGTLIPADPTGRTSVPGVWVAGNVADQMQQVVAAAASGVMAGAAVNMDLIEAEVAAALAG
jgi:thioredoxin reductase